MPDPNLLAAMEEIKAVLARRDIAASIVLSSPGTMEFLRHPQASWNALFLEETSDGLRLRFRCRRADYPTAQAWTEAMRLSAGTVLGFVDALEKELETFRTLAVAIVGKMEVSHSTREEPPPALCKPSAISGIRTKKRRARMP